MLARDFVYWAQGFFEITEAGFSTPAEVTLNAKQVLCFRNHLAKVFHHEIDPAMGDQAHQDELTALHQGGGSPAPDPKSQMQYGASTSHAPSSRTAKRDDSL